MRTAPRAPVRTLPWLPLLLLSALPVAAQPAVPASPSAPASRGAILLVTACWAPNVPYRFRFSEQRLREQGYQTALVPFHQLDDQTLRRFNLVMFLEFSRVEEDLTAEEWGRTTPQYQAALAQRLDRYVQDGGGLLFFAIGNANAYRGVNAYNPLLSRWGAGFLMEQLQDPAGSFQQPDYLRRTYLRADRVFPCPLTEEVKHVWYSAGFMSVPLTQPLKVDAQWQVALAGNPTTFTQPLEPDPPGSDQPNVKIITDRPGTYQGESPLVATRQLGKGRLVLAAFTPTYTVQGYKHPFWADIAMTQGDGTTPSDMLRLLDNTVAYLVAPTLDGKEIGGYVAPPYPSEKSRPAPIKWQGVKLGPASARYFRGVIGARTALSTGSGSVAEWIAAAKAAGLDFLAFAEDNTRALALAVEERLWANLACNWHPLTRHHGGASARHAGLISFECMLHMYHVFGPEVMLPGMDRWAALDGPDFERIQRVYGRQVRPFHTYMSAYANGFANANYHVPDYLAELVYHKPKRYDYAATAEVGPCTDRFYPSVTDGQVEWHVQDFGQFYPGAQVLLRTHLRPHFVLSSASVQFYDGSISRPWHLHYARRDEVQDPVDLGNWECRFVLNRKPVGEKTRYWETPEVSHEGGGPLYPAGWDEGRYFMLQHHATSLVLSRPKFREHWALSGLRQDIALATHFAPPGRVWLGGRELTDHQGESDRTEWVFVNEGAVYVGFLPLIGRWGERATAVRVRRENYFLVISLYNYQGPPVAMKDYEMAWMGNGFVCEVAEAGDYGSFDEFRDPMSAAEVLDDTYHGARTVRYAREGLELAMMVDPLTDHFIFAAINGVERPAPPLAATGLDAERLPFLGPDRELVARPTWPGPGGSTPAPMGIPSWTSSASGEDPSPVGRDPK